MTNIIDKSYIQIEETLYGLMAAQSANDTGQIIADKKEQSHLHTELMTPVIILEPSYAIMNFVILTMAAFVTFLFWYICTPI